MRQLMMRNGRPELIDSPTDFEDLIDMYMGSECADYYHQQIKELSECVKELSTYINDRDIQKDVEEVLFLHGFE